jgi:outer membrane beta-barrel protein
MESRIRSIFLNTAVAATFLSLGATSVWAQDSEAAPEVINPAVERRDIDVAAIDTEDFEITAFFGLMGVEDFESGGVYGARLGYHISESFFAEASFGTTQVGTSSFEKLGGGAELLSNRDLSYYDLSLGYNLFPGEVFVGSKRAMNSVVYLVGGLGSTNFAEDNHFTINLGFGVKVLPTDYVAISLEVRDYMFDIDITGENKTTHNLQGTLNISYFF